MSEAVVTCVGWESLSSLIWKSQNILVQEAVPSQLQVEQSLLRTQLCCVQATFKVLILSVCRLSHGSLSWVADNADPIFTAQHVVAILPQATVGLFLYQVVFTGLSAQLFVHKQLLLTGASECS